MSSITTILLADRCLTWDSKRSITCMCWTATTRNTSVASWDSQCKTSKTLPVLIPSVRVGQDNPNKTIYTVSLTYTHKGVNYISTNSATYVPEDKNGSYSCPAVVEARLLKQILLWIQLLAFRRIGEFNFFRKTAADFANQAPAGDASPLFATVAPYLDLDFQFKTSHIECWAEFVRWGVYFIVDCKFREGIC